MIDVPGFPAPPRPTGEWSLTSGLLTGRAGAGTDHFLSPTGEGGSLDSALLLSTAPAGDFVFSARLEVDFAAAFDAGTLVVLIDDARWAKLCFEASPQVRPMVVSVVTREVSDDANASDVDGPAVHLRIARIGRAYAFHSSIDGSTWEFVRFFGLGDPGDVAKIGFGAQSPTGEGCTARFSNIQFHSRTLVDLRDGS